MLEFDGICNSMSKILWEILQRDNYFFPNLYLVLLFDFSLETWNGMLLFPVETERKLNVQKTFRRHPRRLLNVLCTFKLRAVSTGLIVFEI